MNLPLLYRYGTAFLSYTLGKTHLRYPPLFYSIEATNACNYRCRYCPQGNPDIQALKKGQMGIDLFKSIIKQICRLQPVSRLYLTGTGEPLMHPQLETLISLSNHYGFVPSFSSNGSLFSKERAKSLIDSGDFLLTVDFSSDKKIYEDYRCGGKWETVHENLKNLLLMKKEYRKSTPWIEIRDMSTMALKSAREKEKSLADLRKLFENLPVDKFSQLKTHRWIGNIEQGIGVAKVKNNSYKLCTHPWSILVITWGGEVVACCRDLECGYIVGRVDGKQSIMEAWNGRKMQALRKALAEKRPEEINICSGCDRPLTGGSVGRSKTEMIKKIFWEKITGN
jgi:MoaA/NifB/PqqE/SkfB family radical SAM enzyme